LKSSEETLLPHNVKETFWMSLEVLTVWLCQWDKRTDNHSGRALPLFMVKLLRSRKIVDLSKLLGKSLLTTCSPCLEEWEPNSTLITMSAETDSTMLLKDLVVTLEYGCQWMSLLSLPLLLPTSKKICESNLPVELDTRILNRPWPTSTDVSLTWWILCIETSLLDSKLKMRTH
jgi:hypothetical protein